MPVETTSTASIGAPYQRCCVGDGSDDSSKLASAALGAGGFAGGSTAALGESEGAGAGASAEPPTTGNMGRSGAKRPSEGAVGSDVGATGSAGTAQTQNRLPSAVVISRSSPGQSFELTMDCALACETSRHGTIRRAPKLSRNAMTHCDLLGGPCKPRKFAGVAGAQTRGAPVTSRRARRKCRVRRRPARPIA